MVIFIILFAIYTWIDGDSSGVETIAKIVGGMILFTAVGNAIIFMTDNPIFLTLIAAIAVLVVLIYILAKG